MESSFRLQGQETLVAAGGERLLVSSEISHGHRRFRGADNRHCPPDQSRNLLHPESSEELQQRLRERNNVVLPMLHVVLRMRPEVPH